MRMPRWVQIVLWYDYDADYVAQRDINSDGYGGEHVEFELEYQDWLVWISPAPEEEDLVPGHSYYCGLDYEWVNVCLNNDKDFSLIGNRAGFSISHR